MQREQMIKALVIDSLVDIFERNRHYWLQEVLEHGFSGFARMSTEELAREIRLRNLDAPMNDALAEDFSNECETPEDNPSHLMPDNARATGFSRAEDA
jgi:hypothetical protein